MNDATSTQQNLPLPVYLDMVGHDGNAFMILGRVARAIRTQLRDLGWDRVEINQLVDKYSDEATAGDYDHLLQTTIRWVHTDEEMPDPMYDDE